MPPTFLETKFLDFCHKNLSENISILVAVSGGSDSIALLMLFHKYQMQLHIHKVAVAHVNHGLRGAESDADEQFVRDFAQELNFPFFIKRLSLADPDGSGIEMWARRERYAFFKSVMETAKFDQLATGHTLDDQAETIIMRLMRGSGVRGLRGILPVREDGVCRPLLKLRKMELESWLNNMGQSFRFDSSNSDTRFRRNEIRLNVLPELNKMSPEICENLSSFAERMTYVWSKMVPEIENWLNMFVIKETENLFFIKKSGFANQDIATEGLRSLFEKNKIGFSKSHIEQVIENVQKRGRYLLPGHWMYCSDKEKMIFFKQNIGENFEYDLSVPGVSIFHELNRIFQITTEQKPDISEVRADNTTILIDRDTLDEGLVYRSVCRDDAFQPFGRKNSVNVLQFLSKQGIAKPVRQNLGIVVDRYNKVIWVPAVRINEMCKVSENTKRVLKISMKTLNENI